MSAQGRLRTLLLAQTLNLVLFAREKRIKVRVLWVWKMCAVRGRLQEENERHFRVLDGIQRQLVGEIEFLSMAEQVEKEDYDDDEVESCCTKDGDGIEKDRECDFEFSLPEDFTDLFEKHSNGLQFVFAQSCVAKPTDKRLGLIEWSKLVSMLGWNWDGQVAKVSFRAKAVLEKGKLGLGFQEFLECIILIAELYADVDKSMAVFQTPCLKVEFLLACAHEHANRRFDFSQREVDVIQGKLNRTEGSRRSKSFETQEAEQDALLARIVHEFAAADGTLSSAKFVKLCRACGVFDLAAQGRIHARDVDIAFAKVAGEMRTQALRLNDIKRVLRFLGEKCFSNRKDSFAMIRAELCKKYRTRAPKSSTEF